MLDRIVTALQMAARLHPGAALAVMVGGSVAAGLAVCVAAGAWLLRSEAPRPEPRHAPAVRAAAPGSFVAPDGTVDPPSDTRRFQVVLQPPEPPRASPRARHGSALPLLVPQERAELGDDTASGDAMETRMTLHAALARADPAPAAGALGVRWRATQARFDELERAFASASAPVPEALLGEWTAVEEPQGWPQAPARLAFQPGRRFSPPRREAPARADDTAPCAVEPNGATHAPEAPLGPVSLRGEPAFLCARLDGGSIRFDLAQLFGTAPHRLRCRRTADNGAEKLICKTTPLILDAGSWRETIDGYFVFARRPAARP